MKFDYEAVASAIGQIDSAITAINAAIEDKIPNTTYVSGNAKEAVDSYISSLNSCLDPIVPEITAVKEKIEEVKNTYLSTESGINTALGAENTNGNNN